MSRTGKTFISISAAGLAVLATVAVLYAGRSGRSPAAPSEPAVSGAGSVLEAPQAAPAPVTPMEVASIEPSVTAAVEPEPIVPQAAIAPPAQDWDQIAADAAAVGMTSMVERPYRHTTLEANSVARN